MTLIACVAIAFCASAGMRASAAGIDVGIATKTDGVVAAFLEPAGLPRRTPAISVSVGRNGDLLYATGYGEAMPGQSASADTLYKIGSVTKQFTAAAILRLIELKATAPMAAREITIETPVAQIIDGAKRWSIAGGPPIALKHLLSMTSSLPNFTRRPPAQLDPWGAVPAEALLARLEGLDPSGYPGSFEYSNTSYFLLSEAICNLTARAGRRCYHQVMREEIFNRLGLHDTGFTFDPVVRPRLAAPNFKGRPAFAMPDWLQGSADVVSTVVDLFKWNAALMGGRLLSPAMQEAMFSDAARVDVWTYYGFGWFIKHIDDRDIYFHSGAVPGYTAFNMIERQHNGEWVSVSILANNEGVEGLDDLADRIASMAWKK